MMYSKFPATRGTSSGRRAAGENITSSISVPKPNDTKRDAPVQTINSVKPKPASMSGEQCFIKNSKRRKNKLTITDILSEIDRRCKGICANDIQPIKQTLMNFKWWIEELS